MKYLYQNKHWNINKEYNLDKILYLMIDRPDDIGSYGDIGWLNKKDQYHRDYDLPSYIMTFYNILFWCKNDICHRQNNKPAIIRDNGSKDYFLNGKFIKSENEISLPK